ncbi:MAG: ATP-binding cassette domain-containing protein [Treponema sp.]
MQKNIVIKGIETNNLKKIDVEIVKNGINVIIGPSGSGKSSLAYDTIAEIGIHELNAMYADSSNEPNYKVHSYENIVTSIPIKQMNNNNNVHSTIATYFNISQYLSIIFSATLNKEYDFFVLNKKENICQKCHGLGYTKELDVNRLVDYDKKVEEIPIKCWTRYKDFYIDILKRFCIDEKIDFTKKFRDLTESEKTKILYGESCAKYSLKFKTLGRLSSRTTKYFGIMTGKAIMRKFEVPSQFYSEKTCSECNGEKYETHHRQFKIKGYSIGEVLCLDFKNLSIWIKELQAENKEHNLSFSIQQVQKFVSKVVELNLGYLTLNRIIPSLSGGELQRLRLVQVFNSQISNLLIILDEPLAGLSKIEKQIVYENIKKLSKKHTLLIVDHHSIFFDDASKIIAMGEKSGKYGGSIINTQKYIDSQNKKFELIPQKTDKLQCIKIKNTVYGYKGVDIKIAKNRMNIITGCSGIGKSTLLREYIPQILDNYTYINQKSLSGNSHSFICTLLDIYNPIIDIFAKKFNQKKGFFMNLSGSEGSCSICGGTGKLIYGTDNNDRVSVICKDCKGTGFNKNLLKYTIQGKNIFDIWSMTIDEAVEYYASQSLKITETLQKAQEILLGHLQLGQLTLTLSGGENIRIKILKSLKTATEIYGIDEPFRGLNNFEMYKVALFLSKMVNNGKTIIVVDHEENAFKYFSKKIELIKKDSWLIEK